MQESTDEPNAYLIERVRETLLRDPRIGELDVHITVEGGRMVITGNVSTSERRNAIDTVLAELLPEHEIRNDTSVSVFPEAPDGTLP